jgi:D-glycero-D-manno-heptose 1,7-bisphosphate phosphatase
MTQRSNRGIVFDRDGTVIDFVRDPELGVITPAFHPDQLRFMPGALEGMRALADEGFLLAIATNQPGAAKGQLPRAAIERTNAALVSRLAGEGVVIQRLEACLHHPSGGDGGEPSLIGPCNCRKPLPGLLERIATALTLDPASSWVVGDTPVDIAAARAAGFRAALVSPTGRCELCPWRGAPELGTQPDLWTDRMDTLASEILRSTRSRRDA